MQKQVNMNLCFWTWSQQVSWLCRKITLGVRVWWPWSSCHSSCDALLSCLPHVCLIVSLSVWLFGFALDDFFSPDCSQTDRHTCEMACYCKTVNRLRLVRSGCVWKYMQVFLLREGVQRPSSPWELISTVKCADKTSEVFIMCHIFALSASVPGLLCLFLYHKPCFLLLTLYSIHPSWLCVFRPS